ncbi:unnamed protein product [Lactuca virosa]|uniref:Uncharacterized protein n=1 Tax=Lactuca virosa TaxID=75947 RepID=A0AAU9MIB7_9ASTR|nr:unnamed protein product [Lactuca virosa]
MSKPCKTHWNVVEGILWYLHVTQDKWIVFICVGRVYDLISYWESDYASDEDRLKSPSGYLFNFGRTPISWRSGLQTMIALSTTGAEFIATVKAMKEALYLKQLFSYFGFYHGFGGGEL